MTSRYHTAVIATDLHGLRRPPPAGLLPTVRPSPRGLPPSPQGVIMTSTAETARRVRLSSKYPRAQRPYRLRVVGFAATSAAMTALCTLAPIVTPSARASTTDSLQATSSAPVSAP